MQTDTTSQDVGIKKESRLRSRSPHRTLRLNTPASNRRHRRPQVGSSKPGALGGEVLTRNVLVGLTVAGVAQALLTTVFRLFHVDVFLQAYHLPLSSYANGSFIVSMVSTVSTLAGAWVLDHTATKRYRHDLVGQAGCLFVFCFLTPFFRLSSWQWETAHFVVTVSLYQALYSYTAIMLASIVTDSHSMTEKKRVEFMASGKAVNLITTFVVARIGLAIFDEENLYRFRVFLAILAAVTMALFLMGQSMIQGDHFWRRVRSLRRWRGMKNLISMLWRSEVVDDTKHPPSTPTSPDRPRKLRWRRILWDFASHQNFRAWAVAEMLLQAQITFNGNFLKTFVDHLLLDDFGRDTSDWLLSLVWPVTQIATIFVYLPMQRWGYSRVYLVLFSANFVLSHVLFWFVGESSNNGILTFLLVYSVSTRAVQSAGFHLAMADMVLEMKRRHAKEGRHDEPSVAGLFMGANALLCKPVESILPMLAATVMESGGASRHNLFTLLVYPPMAFSVIQIMAWSFFDLTPRKTAAMRHELQEHQNSNLIDMLEP